MAALDTKAIAERAGVDPAYVTRLADLGLLRADPQGRFGESDVRRIQLMQVMDRSGVSLEGVAAVVAQGALDLDVLDNVSYQVFSPLSGDTFAELNARTGIPLDLLLAIREAVGGVAAGPDDRVREDELTIVPLLAYQLELGFRPLAIERGLRVYGDSLRRIAESEGEWWRSEIEAPIVARDGSSDNVGRVAMEITPRLGEVTVGALLAIYRAQQRHVWSGNIMNAVAGALERAGIQERQDRTPAMCFLDITGYTRLTQEHGDAAAATLAERLARMVQRSSTEHGGRAVKWLGDGVMLYFPDPGRGVVAAMDMVDGVVAAGLPPAHVGLHAGPVLLQQGDYYGHTVNLASRIGDYARPGEVLVSQSVVEASQAAPVTFRPIGPVELKGTADAIDLYIAARR